MLLMSKVARIYILSPSASPISMTSPTPEHFAELKHRPPYSAEKVTNENCPARSGYWSKCRPKLHLRTLALTLVDSPLMETVVVFCFGYN